MASFFPKKVPILTLFLIFFFCILVSISPTLASTPPKLSVFVSIMPQVYFVERIGGQRVEVNALVKPGQSPATYAPTPKQMARLARAKVYFKIGVPFENSLVPKLKRSLPDLPIIDLQKNIELLKIDIDNHKPNNHNHSHEEHELDPHTWLDPNLVKAQVQIIKDTLSLFDPEGEKIYQDNFLRFSHELDDLHSLLQKMLLPYKGKTIFVFHPAYGYFCRAYDLKQKAVAFDGKEPGAKHLAGLIKTAKKEKVPIIFVQPQFSSKSARAIARAINAKVIAIDPLAKDYMQNMNYLAEQVIKAL